MFYSTNKAFCKQTVQMWSTHSENNNSHYSPISLCTWTDLEQYSEEIMLKFQAFKRVEGRIEQSPGTHAQHATSVCMQEGQVKCIKYFKCYIFINI